jgi:small subunit ribosomal protein S15
MGDVASLVTDKDIDICQPRLEYETSKVLAECPPEVKRVLSIEFGRHRDIVSKVRHELVRKVQEHPLDFTSLPVRIARLTVEIRNHQAAITELHGRLSGKKRNQARKHDLKILIDHRRTMLSNLRQRDYKKFEWLLEALNIVYKPRPMENWEAIERRKHQDRLTDLWCDEMRTYRLHKFKQELEQKQPDFLRRKAKLLKEILDEELKLAKTPSVSETEIEETLKKADIIEKKLAEGDRTEKNYFIYEKKTLSDDMHFMK